VQSYANSLAIPAPINILLSTSVVFSGENHIRGGYGNCPEYESYGNNSPDKNNFRSKNDLSTTPGTVYTIKVTTTTATKKLH
jgi:hypothetical protein